MDYVDLLVTILSTGVVTTIINYLLFRRKHRAEASGAETDNEIKLYEGYQKASKDQSEMISFLSDNLKTTQKELVRLDISFNRESRALKKQLEEKETDLAELSAKYEKRFAEMSAKIERFATQIQELTLKNKTLTEENERLKNDRSK